MSGAGISPLAFYDPDLYAKQQAIARQQAFGQALLERGAQGGDYRQPWSGLAAAGNELIGAYLLKRGDRNLAQLYGGGDGSAPSAAPATAAPPVPPQGALPPSTGPVSPSVPASSPPVPAGTIPQGAPTNAPTAPAPVQGGALPPARNMAELADRIYASPTFPKMPGVSKEMAIAAAMQGGPSWQSYITAFYQSQQPTPEQKNIMDAAQGNPELYRQLMLATVNKGATIANRSFFIGPDGVFHGIPQQNGTVATMLPNGQMAVSLAPGAAGALAQSGYAGQAGRALLTPATGYDKHHQPVASNAATMAGQAGPANALVFGNPNGPAQATAPVPAPALPPGVPAPAGGPAVPSPTGDVAGNGPKGVAAPQPTGATAVPDGPLAPAQAPGIDTYYNKVAGEAGQRVNETIDEARGVPTRLNVLGNILQLLRDGAQTGTPEWLQASREQLAGLSQALGHPVDASSQAALMGEIKKYMAQYATRAAQSVGADTDASRELSNLANPHVELFPATLQRMVPWIMANERGIAAKANAQDAWLRQYGNDPAAQQQFETFWRNNYSPRVAQFEMMTPAQKRGYLADPNAFPTQQALQNFWKQEKTLRPYFAMPGQ
jgi:hypothetical protein